MADGLRLCLLWFGAIVLFATAGVAIGLGFGYCTDCRGASGLSLADWILIVVWGITAIIESIVLVLSYYGRDRAGGSRALGDGGRVLALFVGFWFLFVHFVWGGIATVIYLFHIDQAAEGCGVNFGILIAIAIVSLGGIVWWPAVFGWNANTSFLTAGAPSVFHKTQAGRQQKTY